MDSQHDRESAEANHSFRMDQNRFERFVEVADAHHRTAAGEIRRLIEQRIREHEEEVAREVAA